MTCHLHRRQVPIRTLCGAGLLAAIALVHATALEAQGPASPRRSFHFACDGRTGPGMMPIAATTAYSSDRGYGFRALGPEASKKAFVHYAAGTYPDQAAELKDDTHFSNYGAYELARMVVDGLRRTSLPLARQLLPGIAPYDPSRPMPVAEFALPASPAAR